RVPDRLQHGLQVRLGEGALRAVGAGAGAVCGRRIGAGRAFRRVALDPGQHRGGLARGGVVAGHIGLVGADEDRLHVALELEALEHFLGGELVVAAGVLHRPLRAGDARHLVGDLADVAEPHRRRGGGGGGVVALELGVGGVGGGERLRLPFVIDGGRLLALDAGHERRGGRGAAGEHVRKSCAVSCRPRWGGRGWGGGGGGWGVGSRWFFFSLCVGGGGRGAGAPPPPRGGGGGGGGGPVRSAPHPSELAGRSLCPLPADAGRGQTSLVSLLLPGRGAARADECRGVAERAGLFEPVGEVLDARFVRALTGRRGARPLTRGDGLVGRSPGLRLCLAPERRVAAQELQPVVA